jgi:hypothetical protein
MDLANKYVGLVVAVQSHVESMGMDFHVESVPEEDHLPFIIKLSSKEDGQAQAVLMLFPPVEVYLTSRELGVIIGRIREAEERNEQTIMVFSESSLPLVSRLLDTVGITKHAILGTYGTAAEAYRMSWTLDSPPAAPSP